MLLFLEATFRNGRLLAAYLHLPRRPGDRAARTESFPGGLLVDFTPDGRPLGVEITSPSTVRLASINSILRQLGQQPIDATDLAPLQAR